MDLSVSSISFDIKTFGCKVNTYDTGLLQKRLQASGFLKPQENPQVHILNTCAVTHEATKEAIRQARKLRKANPACTIVLTGCSAQVDGAHLDELPEVDLVVANSHKGDLDKILENHFREKNNQKVFRSNIFRNEALGEGGGTEFHHTRSFLKIQDGCNSFCTFCIIPYARGKSRSLSVASLVASIQKLHEDGVNEVVMTGVHIGDYRDEEAQAGLEDLIEAVLQNTTIPRLRLSSLEPIELSDRLLGLFQDPRLCPHFHMSIQSAQSKVLSQMKRQYTAEKVEWALNEIQNRVPGAFVGMDVIVGFPGETDEEFQETYERLSRTPWTRIHVFPYSERQGTRAALSEQVIPVHERKKRSQILRQLSFERYSHCAADQIGLAKKALVLKETKNHPVSRALSRDYWNLQLNQKVSDSQLGQEIDVRITGADTQSGEEGVLFAEVLSANA
jgi:threonylcarbamoyladenosine tRNA methylthiotransferase MtaB